MTTSPETSTDGGPTTRRRSKILDRVNAFEHLASPKSKSKAAIRNGEEEEPLAASEGAHDKGELSDSSLHDDEIRLEPINPKKKSNKKKLPSSHHSVSSHTRRSSSDEEGFDGSAASLFDDSGEPAQMDFRSNLVSTADGTAAPKRASGRLGDKISAFESKSSPRDDDLSSSTWHAGESPAPSAPLETPKPQKKNKITMPAAFLSPTGSRPTPSQQQNHHRGSSLDTNTWHAKNKPPKTSSLPPKGPPGDAPTAPAESRPTQSHSNLDSHTWHAKSKPPAHAATGGIPATPQQKKKNRVVTPSIFMSPPTRSTQRLTSEQKTLQGLSATPLRTSNKASLAQSWHGKSLSTPKRDMADFKPEIQTNIMGFHDRRNGFDGDSPSIFMTPCRQSHIVTSGEKAREELRKLDLMEEDGHVKHQIVEKKVHEFNELVGQSHLNKQDQRERYRNTTRSLNRKKRTNNHKLPKKLIEKKKQQKRASEPQMGSSQEKQEMKPQAIRPATQDDVWTNVGARRYSDNQEPGPPPIFDLSDEQTKIIESVIEDNFLLEDLLTKRTSDAKDAFVQAFEPLKYEKRGEVIVECDVSSDDYYIVQKGQVNFVDDKTKDVLGTAKEGMSFGQLNLLYSAMTDAAVVTAEEGTSLLKVSQATFRHIMKKTAQTEQESSTNDTDEAPDEEQQSRERNNNNVLMQRQNVRKYVESSIRFEDLEKLSMLGEGQFGEVWLVAANMATPKEDGIEAKAAPVIQKKFALKSQYREDDIRGKNAEDAIRLEMELMRQLQGNAFIAELVNTYEDDECIYALMGLLPGGELWDLIHREDPDTGDWINGLGDTGEEAAKFYSLAVADALAFMHSKKIVFRDLKPENVMLDQYGYPVIVDFGFSKQLDAKNDYTCFTFCGTPNYVCPEIIQNSGHSYGADHWALGVLIYEMTVGENPWYYDGMDQMELYHSICNEPPYPFPEGSKFSKELLSLTERLFAKDPRQRLGMVESKLSSAAILQHSWFAGLDLIKLRNKELPAPHLPKPSGDDDNELDAAKRQEEAFISLVTKQTEQAANDAEAPTEAAREKVIEAEEEDDTKYRSSLQSVPEDTQKSPTPFRLEDIVKAKDVGDPNTRLSLNVRSWSGNQKGQNIRKSRENKRDSKSRRSNIKSTLFAELGDLSDDDMD